MKQTIRSIGVVLGALLALGAMAAQGAQAHTFIATGANGRTVITGTLDGESKDELFSTSNSFKTICSSAVFEATQASLEAELETITPTYGSTTRPSGCEVEGVGEAIVHTNHCAYLLFGATNAEGDAPVTIECEGTSENKIQITIPAIGATLSIPAQEVKGGGVHYTNATEGGHAVITVHVTLKKIKVTCAPAIVCAFFGGTEQEEDDSVTHVLRGYEDTGTAASGTAKTTPSLAGSEGAQVGVSVNPGV